MAVLLRADGGAVGDGAGGVVAAVLCQLLADFAQRQDSHRRHLLGVHLARLPKRLMQLLHWILLVNKGGLLLQLLEILLRIMMVEIHLELRHVLLLWLHGGLGVGCGVSSSCCPVVGVVLLHWLVWWLLEEVDMVMVDLLVVGGGEGPRLILELLLTLILLSRMLLQLLGLRCQRVLFSVI